MKKLFTVIRQGKLDEVKRLIEKNLNWFIVFQGRCQRKIMDSRPFRLH